MKITDKFNSWVHPWMIRYAHRVHNMNMLSWDMIADEKGAIKILEVNATSQSSDWLQFDFGGLFGAYTEQVVDWVAKHRSYDRFNHFRTWY